jgi:uncharacterized protein (TIGR03437 family)
VSVTFDGTPGELLYASSSQINVAIPFDVRPKKSTVMQINVNGQSSAVRQLPLLPMVPALFAQVNTSGCGTTSNSRSFTPIALNDDGTQNSCTNPAKDGSVVSFFINGLGGGRMARAAMCHGTVSAFQSRR